MAVDVTPPFRLVDLLPEDLSAEFGRDVAAGLTAAPKRLSCRYFYDSEGSRLFEAICALPEYYLTRAETAILRDHVRDVAADFPGDVTVIELGSGSAKKTRLLLEALRHGRRQVRYVPIDICRLVLEESAAELLRLFPGLDIVAVAAEYHEGLRQLRRESSAPKLVLWLGSNMGNFERTAASVFLRRVRDTLQAGDRVLVGVDLRKDPTVLEAAYDDAAGVTAAFNRNLLARINRELDGNFDLSAFQHRALYDADQGRIEMYLVSTRSQRVSIGQLGLEVTFAAGEQVHTENSYKYSLPEMEAVAGAAGLCTERCWQDAEGRFSLHVLGIKPQEPCTQ
jgi:L-histidine N-alpha-methyltransferase